MQQELSNLLQDIISNPNLLSQYVSSSIWDRAFNSDINGPLITLGGRVLQLTFTHYLINSSANFTKQLISDAINKYLTLHALNGIFDQLDLNRFIVQNLYAINPNLKPDIVRAFIGALFLIGDNINGLGQGYADCYKLTSFLFSDIDLPLTNLAASKTVMKQYLEKLGLPPIIEEISIVRPNNPRITQVTLTLSPQALNYFNQQELNLPTPLAQQDSITSQRDASNKAYEQALLRFRQVGINDRWINTKQFQRYLNSLNDQQLAFRINQRLQQDNFTHLLFNTIRNAQDTCTVELIGVTFSNSKRVLDGITINPCDISTARLELLNRYAM